MTPLPSPLPLASDRAAAPLDELIARLLQGRDQHVLGSGGTEQDLRALEERLGRNLPADFRLFLQRVGGGVFYLRHEIFGARRVMMHDIEMVPDLLSFRATVRDSVPAGWLPIHRSAAGLHAIRLDGEGPAPVRSFGGDEAAYPDFVAFLGSLVRDS